MTEIAAEFFVEVDGIKVDPAILGRSMTVIRRGIRARIDFPEEPGGCGNNGSSSVTPFKTRRNDRFTGVENRAQWIVRGIHEEFVSLVSVRDSGELRTVSHE